MKYWLAIVGAAAIVGGLGVASSIGYSRLFSTSPIALEEVKAGRFVREVTAEGTLKAVNVTPIIVPNDIMEAQKVAWIAAEGSSLRTGDPVVTFDPYDAEKKLTDGRADRDSAESKIDKTKAGGDSSVRSLAIDREIASDELERAEKFAPKDNLIFSRNEIIESEIDRGLLQKRAGAAAKKSDATARRAATDLALNEIEKKKAEIHIRQAEKGLSSLRVLAPHDGLFSLERSWRGTTLSVGETVWPGQTVGEIPDMTSLEAKVYVLEADAGGLEPGRAAKVTIEGRIGAEYGGKVSRVDAIAKTRDWEVPTKYFETILALEKTDAAVMKPGQSVRARITLEQVEDVITIPRQALFEKDGKRVVYRMESGKLSPVEVEVGRHGLSRVVIEKGLRAGDRIALRDPSRTAAEIFAGDKKGETAASEGSAASGSRR